MLPSINHEAVYLFDMDLKQEAAACLAPPVTVSATIPESISCVMRLLNPPWKQVAIWRVSRVNVKVLLEYTAESFTTADQCILSMRTSFYKG